MKAFVVSLVLVVMVIGALALGLDAFQDGLNQCSYLDPQTIGTYNSSSGYCYNGTDQTQAEFTTAYSYEYNMTQEGLAGTANASSYLSTIGTMIGVAALLAVVVGAFYVITR